MDWTKRMVRPWCDGDSDYGISYDRGVRCRGCWLLVEVGWVLGGVGLGFRMSTSKDKEKYYDY
jgi:hypothetical protein